MNPGTTLRAARGILLWWAGLTVLWLVLVSTVDTLEWAVGTSVALVGAVAARAARRAAGSP